MWIWYCHFDASWLFCPLVDADSSLYQCSLTFGTFFEWLVLVVPFYVYCFCRSSCKAGLVVTKSLSNCLFIKDFISPSLMKLHLAGYEILGWKFFSLRTLNIGPYSLLACMVSAEKSAMSLMGFPLCITWLFSLAALSFFLHFNPGESDNYVPWGCSSWGVSLWWSLYFLNLNVGLSC